jgi:hypothetical protein
MLSWWNGFNGGEVIDHNSSQNDCLSTEHEVNEITEEMIIAQVK